MLYTFQINISKNGQDQAEHVIIVALPVSSLLPPKSSTALITPAVPSPRAPCGRTLNSKQIFPLARSFPLLISTDAKA